MPLPTARSAVPMAAVVLPLPGPVLTMMRPLRISSGTAAHFFCFLARFSCSSRISVPSALRLMEYCMARLMTVPTVQ